VSPFTYKLTLPTTIKVYLTFYTSLLRPVTNNLIPGQNLPPPPPVLVDGDDEYAVESIESACYKPRSNRLRFELLVKWKGYETLTWEPLETLEETAALDAFELRYPDWKTTIPRNPTRRVRFSEGDTVTVPT